MISTIVLLIFVFSVAVSAEYNKVVGEKCNNLQTPSALFDYLLPCGVYKSDSVDLVCLTAQETDKYAKTLPAWTLVKNNDTGDSLKRSFTFSDFQQAFLFMTRSAQLAEKNQHHPDWHNLWNTVDVTLTTDDKACLSTFDIELAQGMDLVFSQVEAAKNK